jgi:hypothetical protein
MLKWGHAIQKGRSTAVTHDPSSPAENQDHASEERPHPATFARTLFGHLAEVHGDAKADLYASRVIAELCEISPVVREAISDLILVELGEELFRRGEPGRDAARLVAEVQRDWMQGR